MTTSTELSHEPHHLVLEDERPEGGGQPLHPVPGTRHSPQLGENPGMEALTAASTAISRRPFASFPFLLAAHHPFHGLSECPKVTENLASAQRLA